MPKLHGYRERKRFDLYDCLYCAPPEQQLHNGPKLTQHTRLFGMANIGNVLFTNLCKAQELDNYDRTAVITNIRARTNIPTCPELDEFANATVITPFVGEWTQGDFNLKALLERKEGQDMVPLSIEDQVKAGDAHEQSVKWLAGEIWDRVRPPDDHRTIGDLDPDALTMWMEAADTAINATGKRPIVVPVRQSFHMNVDIFTAVFDRLMTRLLDENKIERPGIWLHVEGVHVRDVG